jgi:3,4-dihydroxy-9,10-secoandrosta-1,3,5(10)-triene-9,17-dione 4,5-dioxygenase
MNSTRISYNGLGYVGVAARDPIGWRDFATDVCGLMPSLTPPGKRDGMLLSTPEAKGIAADGTAFLKMDDRQWRIAVHPGDEPGLRYLGFEVPSLEALDFAVASVRERGAEARPGTQEELEARAVAALAVLEDPAGHRIELFCGPIRDRDFLSPTGASFLTGDLGMGHAVLHVPDIDAALAFYRGVLGFVRSDFMTFGPDGQSIHFLRCTRRHHSIALLHLADLTGLQHLMLEATTIDAVGKALDSALAHDIPISSSLGRHRNDETVSFYMQGPSGFDLEIGWDGLLIGDDWVENEFAGSGDLWGHHGLDAQALLPKGSS